MTLHDFIILMTFPIGTSGYNEIQMILLIGTLGYNIRYTSKYIPKLQIHQHSLLTRKVFSWHNSSAQVFFSESSSKLDHHWIIIKYGSSLNHHQVWIIIGSSSSLDHHWINIKSSSSLYQHQVWIIIIITASAISINWFHLSILLIMGSSTKVAPFHTGCRPSLHVGLHLL